MSPHPVAGRETTRGEGVTGLGRFALARRTSTICSSMNLITAAWPDVPGFDTAFSHSLVEAVGDGQLGDTLRLHRTGPIVAFGRRDVVSPGYRQALRATIARGFQPVERLAGGRAAVFHEETLAFSWATPASEPRADVEFRFRHISRILAEAIRSLGVDARVGEVPGEYCPGAFSINARGKEKIMGVGQRLIRGAAHVGGVIVVDGADRIRDVLMPVYDALDIEWDPTTSGSIAREVGSVGLSAVHDAVVQRFELEGSLTPIRPPDPLVTRAAAMVPTHLPR